MTTKIEKNNFYIQAARVPSALNELKQTYPEITGLNYESDAYSLQYLLHLIGFHTRIHPNGSIFTISKIAGSNESDPLTMLNILSKYMDDNCTIVVTIDDNTYTFTNTGCVNAITDTSNVEEPNDTTSALPINEEIKETDPEESEQTLIESVKNVTEKEKIVSKSTIDSKNIKRKGGRPKKEIKK